MSQLLHGGDLFIAVGSEPFNIDEFLTGVNSKCNAPYSVMCMAVLHVCVCVGSICSRDPTINRFFK